MIAVGYIVAETLSDLYRLDSGFVMRGGFEQSSGSELRSIGVAKVAAQNCSVMIRSEAQTMALMVEVATMNSAAEIVAPEVVGAVLDLMEIAAALVPVVVDYRSVMAVDFGPQNSVGAEHPCSADRDSQRKPDLLR